MPTVKRHSSSSQQLSVVQFRRNTSQQVGEGIEEAMKSGILGGFPVVGVKATVYDGSYHEVDSSVKWHSTLQDLWHSRKLWQKLHQFYLSQS